MSTFDRAALDHVAAMTDAELASFIREARQPAQLTRADVNALYRNRQYEAIEDARAAGRLDALMNGDEQ